MKKYELITLISLVIVIAIPLLLLSFMNPTEPPEAVQESKTEKREKDKKNTNNEEKEDKSDEIYWGVDSASYTEEEFLGCVIDNYGKPSVWGRYLVDKEGVSFGLDEKEVKLLHENDIKILVIYNHVVDARGYNNGVNHAEEAIAMANSLGIPKGVAIFVDIEPDYPVDAQFIEGWYDKMSESDYEPGVYGVFSEKNDVYKSFEAMKEDAQKNTLVWTAFPQAEISTKENAPQFDPIGPEKAKVYGWQYAIDGETCNIDTNLFNGNMMEFLW